MLLDPVININFLFCVEPEEFQSGNDKGDGDLSKKVSRFEASSIVP